MKSRVCASILALILVGFAPPRPTAAQAPGQSASGVYKFLLEDNLAKYVEFAASTDEKGNTTGSMTFNDEARVSERDVEGDGERAGDPMPFYMKAEFDTLTVEKNRALMSGIIRDSSHQSYIGRWVQLVVEDNVDNKEAPDRIVWRFCQPEAGGWIPSDYEVPGDRGAWMSWWATDAERKGDVGIPSQSLIPDEKRRCEMLPLWTYAFADLKRWDGDIRVVQP
ncbi:MAG TPA: hypothetical protein VM864_02950 [Pyrinomonadaceae bacterium]|jgi:hypothetical protein|nr:hypothetical protein [Pyrinomonadaceae bacterium]